MSKIEDFLNTEEEQAVVNAIAEAEKNTSGELRVHLEKGTNDPPIIRAYQVFRELGMHQTKARNGVLIYVGVETHQFAIYGDVGIDEIVNPDFWEKTKEKIQYHFEKKQFKKGLVEGIKQAGKCLSDYFPYNNDDKNELPNTISMYV
jgi:uncharacterized membrane protein